MWYPNGSLYDNPAEWWPMLVPSVEYADFTYDATNDIPPGDAISGLSIVVAPSGMGEVTMSRLTLTDGVLVSVWITGGQPGRTYLYELVINTAVGRRLAILIGQVCTPVLVTTALPPAPTPGFSTAIVWP